jgi:SET domain-containing protein
LNTGKHMVMKNRRIATRIQRKHKSARGCDRPIPLRVFRVGRAHTGLGLFATAPIKKGAVIIEYLGLRIPTPEAEARERRYGSKYMFKINRRWSINGSSRSNLARYLNHSCRPNSKAFIERGRIIVRAFKTIAPDDEITFNYGHEYVRLFIRSGCKCMACTGTGA